MAQWRRSKVRKWAEGRTIKTRYELIDSFDSDNYLWWNRRAYHPKIIKQWSWAMLENMVLVGALKHAVLTPEWIAREAEAEDAP